MFYLTLLYSLGVLNFCGDEDNDEEENEYSVFLY